MKENRIINSKPKVKFFEGLVTFEQLYKKFGKEFEESVSQISEFLLQYGIESIEVDFQSKEAKDNYFKLMKEKVKQLR